MKKEIINIADAAKTPHPFSHVVRAGGFLFISSQISCDIRTNHIIEGDAREQTRNALNNLKFLVESSGGKIDDVVKVTIYMKDKRYFEKINEVYREFFREGSEPARVAVEAKSPIEGVDVEIDAVAVSCKG